MNVQPLTSGFDSCQVVTLPDFSGSFTPFGHLQSQCRKAFVRLSVFRRYVDNKSEIFYDAALELSDGSMSVFRCKSTTEVIYDAALEDSDVEICGGNMEYRMERCDNPRSIGRGDRPCYARNTQTDRIRLRIIQLVLNKTRQLGCWLRA